MSGSPEFQQDLTKLAEAALYLIGQSERDPYFGMTKLVKLLYYADCASFLQRGQPITGTTYLHFPHGPYPENWHLVRKELENSGAATIFNESAGNDYHRYRITANRPADYEILGSEDLAILDAQLQRFAGFNASAIEEHSHHEAGWRATEDGEPISYALSGITAPPLSQRTIRTGRAIADDIAQGR